MGGAYARRLCPQAIVVPPRMAAYAEASRAVYRVFEDTCPLVEGLSIDEAFLDVRGMRRIAGTPARDRGQPAPRRARAGGPAHHRRGRADEVSGQGGKRCGQARRPARGAARRRARVPAPVAGRAALGRRPGDGGQAARARYRHGRRGRRARRGGARRRCSAAAAGRHLHALAHNRDPRPVQARRRRGSIGSQRALGRAPRSAAGDRRHAGRARRSRHPADAGRRPGRPHRRAAAALRRLLACHPVAHAAARDGRDPDHPRHRQGAPHRGDCR